MRTHVSAIRFTEDTRFVLRNGLTVRPLWKQFYARGNGYRCLVSLGFADGDGSEKTKQVEFGDVVEILSAWTRQEEILAADSVVDAAADVRRELSGGRKS